MKSDSGLVKALQFTVLLLTLTNLGLVVYEKLEQRREKKNKKNE